MMPREIYPTQQTKTVLDYFADQVDYQIQNQLVSELMTRYVEVSRQLEQKHRQLEQSDANRREAQKIAALGNWRIDIATRSLWWSDTMGELLELEEPEEGELQRFLDTIHPGDLPLAQLMLESISRGIEPPPYQLRLMLGEDRIKWVHIRCVMHRDLSGTPVAVHGTIQDITASKLAEEKLQKYNDHLEELVEEKVKVISASQLSTIFALVKLAESRDDDTGNHIGRTAAYCRLLAEKLFHSPKTASSEDNFINVCFLCHSLVLNPFSRRIPLRRENILSNSICLMPILHKHLRTYQSTPSICKP